MAASKRLIVLLALALSGCKHPACLRDCMNGHYYTIMQPMWVGKTVIMIPQQHFTCDHYGPAYQNPESEEKCSE